MIDNETDDMMDNTSTGVCAGRAQKALKQHITYEIMHLDKVSRPGKLER